MKVLCLTKNFRSQTPSGGYDQLARFIGADTVHRPMLTSPVSRLAEKAWNFSFGDKPYLFSHLSHGYRFEDRLAEENAFWRTLIGRAEILHVLYADWMLDTLLRRKGFIPAHLVGTFHLPAASVADRFERAQREALKRLDGAFLVASNDVDVYSNWLGSGKVAFIPHGINIDVFQPAVYTRTKNSKFVFIGMMLRDFETAHRVIDRCRHDGINAEFIVVISGVGATFFTGCTNVQILCNIPEQKLISIYRSCDALFLPVLDSTANNSILEALACGLPVISTRIGGVPDYLDESCGWLLPPGDVDAAFECVRAIANDRDRAMSKRAAARLKAENFSWERISEIMLAAYSTLQTTGRLTSYDNGRYLKLPEPESD